MKKLIIFSLCLLCFEFSNAQSPFLGQILVTPYNFCPRGTLACNGQLLAISSNTALFSLLGTTYGGDGRTSFGIPNLQSRTPIHTGQGPGLSQRSLGSSGGAERHVLVTGEIPRHQHGISASDALATMSEPILGNLPAETNEDSYAIGNLVNMQETSLSGGGQPHNNMPPFLTINYCICTTGVFPSRN